MYNSQYYTCEQIDERLLQGYVDDYNTKHSTSLTKDQFLTMLGSLFNKEFIVQQKGPSTTVVMSQKAVHDFITDQELNHIKLINGGINGSSGTMNNDAKLASTDEFIAKSGLRITLASGFLVSYICKYDRDSLSYLGYEFVNADVYTTQNLSSYVIKFSVKKSNGEDILPSELDSIITNIESLSDGNVELDDTTPSAEQAIKLLLALKRSGETLDSIEIGQATQQKAGLLPAKNQWDAYPKDGSSKLVDSKGIASFVQNLSAGNIQLISGCLLGNNGKWNADSTYACTANYIDSYVKIKVAQDYIIKYITIYDRKDMSFLGYTNINSNEVLLEDPSKVFRVTFKKTNDGNISENELNSIISSLDYYPEFSKNHFVSAKDFTIKDNYINSSGQNVSNSDWVATDYITLESNAKYLYVNIRTKILAYNAFYDSNYEKISVFQIGEIKHCAIVKIPENAVYIRLCTDKKSLPATTVAYNFDLDAYIEQIKLANKTIFYTEVFPASAFLDYKNPATGETNNFYRTIYKKSIEGILRVEALLWASSPNQLVFCAFDANENVIESSKIFSTADGYVSIIEDVKDTWAYISASWVASSEPSPNTSNITLIKEKESLSELIIPHREIDLADFSIKNKYLSTSGELIANNDWDCTEKIPVTGYNKLYLFNIYIDLLAVGLFYDEDDNIISRFQNNVDRKIINIPDNAVSVQLTNSHRKCPSPIVYLFDSTFFYDPVNKKTERNNNIVYKSVVRKPFVFNGKTAIFTGDSITYGFVTPSDVTTDNYAKLFSNSVGMNFSNISVGGALITPGVNEVKSITEQVQDASKNIDYLFIAGGINDWQTDTAYATFKQAVDNLCDYINENYAASVQVIWITPINNGGRPFSNPSNDLQMYRNIMTTEILGHDTYNRFSIIQGNEAPFPGEYDNTPDGVTIMFGDGLHPSRIGYRWYAEFLKTLLL